MTKIKDLDPKRRAAMGFQNVAATATDVANNGTAGTMQGQSLAAPTPQAADAAVTPDPNTVTPAPAGANPDAEAHAAVDDTYAKLNQILGAQQGVDYEGKYKELVGQAQGQKTPAAPGRAESFFATLGSPQNAPGMLDNRRSEAAQAEKAKFERVMSLKEAILHGSIQQEMQKGDFKKALAQSAELEKLHATQARLNREADMKDFTAKQDVLQGDRVELQRMRDDAANERVTAAINGRSDLAKLSASERAKYSSQVMSLVRSLITQRTTNVDGSTKPTYSVEEAVSIAMQTLPAVQSGTEAIGPPAKKEGEVSTPPASGISPEAQRRRDALARLTGAKPK